MTENTIKHIFVKQEVFINLEDLLEYLEGKFEEACIEKGLKLEAEVYEQIIENLEQLRNK